MKNIFQIIALLIIVLFMSLTQSQTNAEIKSIVNNLCLGPVGNDASHNKNVAMYSCDGSIAQKWYYDNSTLEIRNAATDNCLDLASGAVNDGANIRIWSCNGAINGAQDWIFNSNGTITNLAHNKCLDVAINNNVQQWTCDGDLNQYWYGDFLPGTMLPTTAPSKHPTSDPTSDPTEDPTEDPTADPTKDPTADPSKDPTSDPTMNPTSHPTIDPTIDPSRDPTNDPSADPTSIPSENPTNPTTQPSMRPTVATASPTGVPSPSSLPTLSSFRENTPDITISLSIVNNSLSVDHIINIANKSVKAYFNDTGIDYRLIAVLNDGTITLDVYLVNDINGGNDIDGTVLQNNLEQDLGNKAKVVVKINKDESINDDFSEFEQNQEIFQQLTFIIAASFLFIIAISWIDAKFIRKNDFYQAGPLFGALFHVLDTWTDAFFALQCVSHPYFILGSFESKMFIIFSLSVIFIIVPMVTTLYQLYQVSNKHWSKNDDLRGYLSAHLYSLYMVSIICGSSFAGIKLFRSRLFDLSAFDIPLSKQDTLHFETKKIYSTILLENIPQLIIAIWYIPESGKATSSIVFLSMASSLISIIVTIISMYTAKSLVNSQDYYSISFDVTGNIIASKIKIVRNRVKKLQKQMAVLYGVSENLVEITKPTVIPNGVKLHINIYLAYTKILDMNIQSLMADARDSNQLQRILKDSWKLIPKTSDDEQINIGEFAYIMHESKIRKEQSVTVKVEMNNQIKLNKNNHDGIVIYGQNVNIHTNVIGSIEMMDRHKTNENDEGEIQIKVNNNINTGINYMAPMIQQPITITEDGCNDSEDSLDKIQSQIYGSITQNERMQL